MAPHQIEMVKALINVPEGCVFTSGDMHKKYGYPHKDASRVLQQMITWQGIDYAEPDFDKGKIQYRRAGSDDYIHSFYKSAVKRFSR
jgi:hypothetical protein